VTFYIHKSAQKEKKRKENIFPCWPPHEQQQN
jgi:hypothetical protein